MEPESSLPCLQESDTGSYYKPDEYSVHPLTQFMIHFNIILSFTSSLPFRFYGKHLVWSFWDLLLSRQQSIMKFSRAISRVK